MISNQIVIEELMKMAKEIQISREEGNDLGLNDETAPQRAL